MPVAAVAVAGVVALVAAVVVALVGARVAAVGIARVAAVCTFVAALIGTLRGLLQSAFDSDRLRDRRRRPLLPLRIIFHPRIALTECRTAGADRQRDKSDGRTFDIA